MSGKKALFLDIDGTLVMDGLVPFREDLEAMEEAAGKGHLLFLNTGRSFANIPPVLLSLPFIAGIAAGGGSHVLLTDSAGGGFQTVYHKWVPGELLEKVITWYGKRSLCCILEGERDCYIVNRAPRLFTVKPAVQVCSADDFKNKSRLDFITKLTLGALASEDEGRFLEPFFRINSFADYSEAIIKGENKAKAMELILKKSGLTREDSIAAGDSANDLEMIRFAGLGIAMGNASPELKAAAGAITGDCGKGGIAQALRKFLL